MMVSHSGVRGVTITDGDVATEDEVLTARYTQEDVGALVSY